MPRVLGNKEESSDVLEKETSAVPLFRFKNKNRKGEHKK